MFTATVKIASLAIAAAFAGIGASPALAASSGESRSVEVRHGDLDLTTVEGVARLNHRIKVAAAAACGSYDIRDLSASQRARECRNEAIAQANPKVELAIAQARSGNRLASGVAATVSVP